MPFVTIQFLAGQCVKKFTNEIVEAASPSVTNEKNVYFALLFSFAHSTLSEAGLSSPPLLVLFE